VIQLIHSSRAYGCFPPSMVTNNIELCFIGRHRRKGGFAWRRVVPRSGHTEDNADVVELRSVLRL